MLEQRKYLPGFVVNVDRTKVVMFTHTESATQGVKGIKDIQLFIPQISN